MAYDLVIKNGTVIDGSGLARYRADVGVRHGRIATIGRIREGGREVIDVDGQVVAPGFVDGHTHMDAQIFWDPLGTSSCWHGITSVVMGNCGFTLAPCAASDKHFVVRNLQRAEDIPPAAMEAGIEWRWTTFPEFLDCLESLPKGINYAGYLGHSALRTYVMGERAFEQPAGEDDLRAMERELRDAIRAGAIGFTTSRSPSHETPDGRPVASRSATWDEVRRLVGAMGDLNAGLFELAGEGVDREAGDPALREYHVRLRDLAVETGRPVTFGVFSRRGVPDVWRAYLALLDETAAAGGRMFAQVHSRSLSALLSFKTQLPFDHLPVWKEFRTLPLDEQRRGLRDPGLRKKLIEAAGERVHARAGRAHGDVRAGHAVGLRRPRADPPRAGRGSGGVRPGYDRRRDAGSRGRPARWRAAPHPARARHRSDGGEWRDPAPRRQAHGRASRPSAARTALPPELRYADHTAGARLIVGNSKGAIEAPFAVHRLAKGIETR